ncbi:MAG: glutamate-cysteine ligase [Clostridia bacterium]|nr:glutamate-cysteine ligase [Clostridia bacterium]NCC42615.1 glutamate-cysteine ligase [Clostridia bacterium]
MDQYEQNLSLLVDYFQKGCKLNCFQKLGLEVEHFLVKKDTKESVSYYGEHGVAEILERLKSSYPRAYYEGDELIGLYNSDYSLSLEPAAQLEISINPRGEIRHIKSIYEHFVAQVTPILDEYGYELVNLGYQPKSCINDLKLIPKKRYDYMDEYFKTSGTKGANMMRGTASAQISIDFFSEEDFVKKIRVAYTIMPAIKLLCDCTPIFEGERYKKHMARTMIWKNVDKKRCGIIPGLFDDDFGFLSYAKYMMELPLIFVPNNGEPVFTKEQTAAMLWKDREFTEDDMEHVLSMAFPDVRLKHYLEIRGADCMPFPYIMGYLALIKGIFFYKTSIQAILEDHANEKMILSAEEDLMEHGFDGKIYGQNAADYLKRIIAMAKENLRPDEQEYLAPMEEIIKEKRTLADYYEK